MGTLTNDQMVQTYVDGLCNGGIKGKPRGGTIFLANKHQLVYQRRGGHKSRAWGPVILAEWSPDQNLFLLNGDGFRDPHATNWQTRLRSLIQAAVRVDLGEIERNQLPWGLRTVPNANGRRYILVPFQALEGANIDRQTIKPVDVRPDGFHNIWHSLPGLPPIPDEVPQKDQLPSGWQEQTGNYSSRVFTIAYKGHRFRLVANANREFLHKSGTTSAYRPAIGAADVADWTERLTWKWPKPLTSYITVSFRNQWVRPMQRSSYHVPPGETFQDDPKAKPDTWGYAEREHFLGASVFSAKKQDGNTRHLFVSAFDELEPRSQPMYFLAQLPGKQRAKTYKEALDVLAPPIVHEAWKNKTPVHRQGDVFAIQTDLSEEEVYKDAITRVRREVVLANVDTNVILRRIRDGVPWPEPVRGEVRERIDCPCGCGHKRWGGQGPKARRALSIYRTGHTATEVVVTPRGTFIRGTMHHDPMIEEPGRNPEHRPVKLGTDEAKFWLAVRNTVPRARRKPTQSEGV